ncbi:MAG: radical SAM protein [Sandaracinaceae bacterium]|nr:radical SAM protein [Sandaracinaceae bacterium]
MDPQHHPCSTELRAPRSVPLDGARLLFDPRTGLNLRVEGPSTRGLVRTAPRVVLFGITNQCNLRCSFCSRDSSAPSEWTPDSAFEMLTGLAERGVLEVAFGGGEPLAFRGFDELVERLATETSLAVHITTNGVLLTTERLARIAPHLGEVRLSIYDDTPWPERVAALADAPGAVWGEPAGDSGPSTRAGPHPSSPRRAGLPRRGAAALRGPGGDPAAEPQR